MYQLTTGQKFDNLPQRYFSDETATDSELGNKAMESAGVGGAIGVTAGAILAALAAIGTSITPQSEKATLWNGLCHKAASAGINLLLLKHSCSSA